MARSLAQCRCLPSRRSDVRSYPANSRIRDPRGIITRSSTHFLLDGEPYRFTGINIYNAQSDGWCGPAMRYGSTLGDALTSIGPGKGVLRTWFFQGSAIDYDTNQRDWSAFDHTLQVADAHGMKVIATLTDQWGECGTHVSSPDNGIKYEPWYVDGYKQIQAGMLASYRRLGRRGGQPVSR